MAAKEKNLSDALYESLRDVYWAEKQSVQGARKSAKAAKSSELKQAFEQHREESAGQVERLEQVFEMLGKPARAKTCEAMKGLSTEMEEDLEDFGDTAAADAVLIGCGQAVEHYEIARYGMLKTWARQLGMEDAARLLDETLQEEKRADELLTQIAEASANAGAGQGKFQSGTTRILPAEIQQEGQSRGRSDGSMRSRPRSGEFWVRRPSWRAEVRSASPDPVRSAAAARIEPMEARLVEDAAGRAGLAVRAQMGWVSLPGIPAGDDVELRAKSGKPLAATFPKIVAATAGLPARRASSSTANWRSRWATRSRSTPCRCGCIRRESRIRKLAAETPAILMLFDCLAEPGRQQSDGRAAWRAARGAGSLLRERRSGRNALAAVALHARTRRSAALARPRPAARSTGSWPSGSTAPTAGRARDAEGQAAAHRRLRGRRLSLRRRTAARSARCCSAFTTTGPARPCRLYLGDCRADRAALTEKLEALTGPPGFTGKAPGGPEPLDDGARGEWEPLRPELVVEVRYDHVTGDRFRHGTRLLRWRPDKAPRQCTFDQLQPEAAPSVVAAMVQGTRLNRTGPVHPLSTPLPPIITSSGERVATTLGRLEASFSPPWPIAGRRCSIARPPGSVPR